MKREKDKPKVDSLTKRQNISFLMIMFPSLLLSILPGQINGSVIYALLLKVLVLGYQYVMTQNFVKNVYE